MALESFYGGKQGVSPVIKAKFKYINAEDPAYQARLGHTTELTKEEARWLNDVFNTDTYEAGNNQSWTSETLKPFTMNECLKDVYYTDVWYGELCIIDTDNKLNPYNGMLFKRTLKQYDNRFAGTEYTLYAEYIGQIVGPSGGIPNFDLGSVDTERKKAVGKLPTYDTETASETQPLSTTNWDYSYPKDNSGTVTTENPQGDDTKIAELLMGDGKNIEIVPGKDGDIYHDTIKYTWCNVRRKLEGKDDDVWIYLGFEIPYSWFDVERTEIQYWDSRTNLVEHSQKGTDNKEHPFYHNLHFYIPRGARGIGPEELFIVGKDNHDKPKTLYDFDAITYNQSTDTYSVDTNKIKENLTDLTYWVAKWRLYNPKTTDITDVYQYIGAYKDVKSVQLLDNGKLQMQYSNSNTWYDLGTITWIDDVKVVIDTADSTKNTYGNFTITIGFNSDKPDYIYKNNLHLIKDVTYNDNTGQIKFDYSDINGGTLSKTTGNIIYDKDITINDTSISNDYGKVIITKNTGESRTEATLPLIKNASYNKDTGEITFTYSGDIGNKTVGTIEYISKMRITDNGTIQYKYNTDDSNTSWRNITNGTNNTPIKIKDIKDANIDDNTGHLIITYRDDSTKDVGQVKTKPIISPVLRIKNADNAPNYTFSTTTAIEDLLNGTADYIDPQDNTTIVKSDGTIKVSGQDGTGGIVVATVNHDNYIYYYDTAQGNWVNLGTFGTANAGGTSAENLIIEKQDSESSDSNYKVTFSEGSFITFKDGTNNAVEETPIIWPWINRALT